MQLSHDEKVFLALSSGFWRARREAMVRAAGARLDVLRWSCPGDARRLSEEAISPEYVRSGRQGVSCLRGSGYWLKMGLCQGHGSHSR